MREHGHAPLQQRAFRPETPPRNRQDIGWPKLSQGANGAVDTACTLPLQDSQSHGHCKRGRKDRKRFTLNHWRGRNRQWRGRHAVAWVIGEAETDKGEAYMQLHGSLARPKQAMARPTCSCIGCTCMGHWRDRGRDRQRRGRQKPLAAKRARAETEEEEVNGFLGFTAFRV